MKDPKDITALVFDHGLFLPLAQKLAETYKRVLYHTPWEQSFPTLDKCIIGDGFDRVEWCGDIWKVKKDVDLFIFPDIQHAGLQQELKDQGCAVWGSGSADTLEMNREKFHRVLGEVGLEVPVFERIMGVTALGKHLRDKTDKIIKISKYRGSFETGKWRNWAVDEGLINSFAVRFGPARELVPFLVFDPIDTEIELGCDTFNVRGQWPDKMIQGYENKDAGFLCAVRPTEKMPEQVREVLDAFGPVLGEHGYANSFSMEIRVQDDKSYFIDPCCRFPMPPTSSKLELWSNLSLVILAGAHGELVQPETSAPFSAECAVKLKMEKGEWGCIQIPPELEQWLKCSNCCNVDGVTGFPPLEFRDDTIGWLVATGDTIKETLATLVERVGLLPAGLDVNLMPLVELLEQIHAAEAQGIEFTPQEVPEPESVLEK